MAYALLVAKPEAGNAKDSALTEQDISAKRSSQVQPLALVSCSLGRRSRKPSALLLLQQE